MANSEPTPVVFDEFFDQGFPEEQSPFLTQGSRRWGIQLDLKASLLSALFLLGAFVLHFFSNATPVSNLLLIGVYFFVGIPPLIESIEDLTKMEVNIDVLMTLAAFSSILIGNPLEGGLLLVLFAISGSMEDVVESKAKGAISSLYKLSPPTAWIVGKEGKIYERSVKDIKVGEYILVRSGEIIPLDGIVTEGVSSVNMVHLTGENLPVTKKIDDAVPAGSQNMEGTLTIKVTRRISESTIARIIELVTQAQEAKPKVQRWFDAMSRKYAMWVIGLTVFFSCALPLLFSIPVFGVEGSIYRSLAFLIAASPCALIIAVPIAYLSAVSICAKKGILLKGGAILDALASCKAIAFDKTGTLTTGELEFIEASAIQKKDTPGISQTISQAIQAAVTLEKHSTHPIGRAMTKYAHEQNIAYLPMEDFKTIPGYGIEANISQLSHKIFIGNPEYIFSKISQEEANLVRIQIDELRKEGHLIAVMLMNEQIFLFSFSDTLRPQIRETIRKLNEKRKWELYMLTGDHPENAKKIAQELHIRNYYSELRPEDKLKFVDLIAEKKGLAMVGDGINDAPALARATVGICMGKVGSGAAMEASDIVLLHDNLEHLHWLLTKAEKTVAIVRQNLILAAGVILLATTPALLGYIPLWLAVILHEGGTVCVGLNALRLLEK